MNIKFLTSQVAVAVLAYVVFSVSGQITPLGLVMVIGVVLPIPISALVLLTVMVLVMFAVLVLGQFVILSVGVH